LTLAPGDGYYQSDRYEIWNFLPGSYSKVLEVGCAAGEFSRFLKRKPCELWGVEPNTVAAGKAADCADRVLIGRYEDVERELPDGYFDLVVCNDVIEHMTDHDAFLESIKRKMAPNACLVGSIPNVRHISCLVKILVLKDWPYAASGILDYTHLRFFTRKSLRRTLLSHSFKIDEFRGVASIFARRVTAASMRAYAREIAYRLVAAMVVGCTLGYYADIQYLQYGFRVTQGDKR
jgi:2-polyprenyl-3-methyl-5-hydroxy-6-metoxy-1,4-benzoquinol methylase